MSEAEWDGTSWDVQRSYLEGLSEDESIPFSYGGGDDGLDQDGLPAGIRGPQRRTADTGQEVIDLAAMRRELEAQRGGG